MNPAIAASEAGREFLQQLTILLDRLSLSSIDYNNITITASLDGEYEVIQLQIPHKSAQDICFFIDFSETDSEVTICGASSIFQEYQSKNEMIQRCDGVC